MISSRQGDWEVGKEPDAPPKRVLLHGQWAGDNPAHLFSTARTNRRGNLINLLAPRPGASGTCVVLTTQNRAPGWHRDLPKLPSFDITLHMNTRSRAGLTGRRWLAGITLCVALAGCVSAPEVDWNTRLGSYTRDMALGDLGQPTRTQTLSDGRELLEWARVSATQNSWSNQTVSRESIYNDTPGAAPNRVLHLTFGPDGKLVDWNRNY